MKTRLFILIIAFNSISSMAQIPSWMPSNGLVAWYPFNGNSNDESGNGHNGIVNTATLTTDRNNTTNSAYLFNGSSGYISIADAPDLRLNNTDFTISAWIYETSYNSNNADAIISKRFAGVSGSGYILCTQGLATTSPGNVNFQVSGGIDPKALSSSSVSINNWHNIIIQYSYLSQELDIYIDGVFNSTTAGMPSPSFSATSPIWIGNDVAGSPYCFHGKIDDISIYKRKLQQCEIKQLFNAAAINITQQPVNQAMINGGTAKFVVTATGTNLSYQWQEKAASSWANLANTGPYSGSLNDTLVISPVSTSMLNYQYRCIITSGLNICPDTTTGASFTSGINENNIDKVFNLYPNPFNDNINIMFNAGEPAEMIVYDITGREVIRHSFNDDISISTGQLEKGVYFYELRMNNRVVKTGKLMRQ